MTQNINQELEVNEIALIMGTLLGDGHMQKRGNSYRLKIEHGIAQESYVHWKYEKLKKLCLETKPPKRVKSKKGYTTVVFYTSSSQRLAEIYSLFYKKQEGGRFPLFVKTITPELIEKLPMIPLLLAVFFMDDGSVRDDCYAGKLATQGFSLQENHYLNSYLGKWGLQCNVVAHLKSKQQYYLSIPSKSFINLVEIIGPVVSEIPNNSMVYKLNDSRRPRND